MSSFALTLVMALAFGIGILSLWFFPTTLPASWADFSGRT